MKTIGVLVAVAGFLLGLYVGIWVFFIGGIVDVINGASADPVNAKTIAWGLAEVVILAQGVGWLIAVAFGAVGAGIFGASDTPRRGALR